MSGAGARALYGLPATSIEMWNSEIQAWRDYMGAAGTPVDTIKLRSYHLGRVAAGVGAPGPAHVTFDALTQWLAAQTWKPNTRRSYRTSLRAFYAWAMATGRVTTSPAHLLPAVRVPRGKPRPTPETIYRVAVAVADERARLAILLAGQCGLRRGEVARVRVEDLEPDLIGWTLRVVGKGGHLRLVPVPDEVAALIRHTEAGWVFPSSHRPGQHLTPHHLGKVVKRCLEDYTTHTLRHRAGTLAYRSTKDIRAVQEFLGHASPDTTAIYTDVPAEDVRAAMMGAA